MPVLPVRLAPLALVAVFALGWAVACGPSEEELAQRMATVRTELAALLRGDNLSPESQTALEDSRAWRALQEFYGGETAPTVWVDGEGPREPLDELIDVLGGRSAGEGTSTEDSAEQRAAVDYGAGQLVELRDRAQQAVEDETPEMGRRLAELELAASYAFLTRAFHAIEGRVDPRRLSDGWYLEKRKAKPLELLAKAREGASPTDVLAGLEPQHEDYRRLLEARERYRAIVDGGGWPQIPTEGESLEEGASGPRVAALRQRLALEGDLAGGEAATGKTREAGDGEANGAAGATFDAELTRALRRFQERHGLAADGVVDGSTLEALNVPAEERLRTLELNLERWYWMPADLGDHHVVVNIPEYRLRVMRDGEERLGMNVIVGKRMNLTPVFSDTITHLVLNPAWNVPRSITDSEVVPKILANPGYAASQGIEVVGPGGERMPPGAILGRPARHGTAAAPGSEGAGADGEEGDEDGRADGGGFFSRLFGDRDDDGEPEAAGGSGATTRTAEVVSTLPDGYRLRQAPGPKNPLGQVKFMFPNEHNIYLHDTPTDHLFTSAERGFSHGCIRLEKPLDLAAYLLDGAPDWSRERIEQTVGGSEEISVPLPEEIPVHLTYFTARVEDDGRVHFRSDLYDHDRHLAEALARREVDTLDLSPLGSAAPAASE